MGRQDQHAGGARHPGAAPRSSRAARLEVRLREQARALSRTVEQLARQVVERQRAEEEVSDLEAANRVLLESNPAPMWILDAESLAFVAVNDAAVHAYGYARAEMLRMTMLDLRPRGQASSLREWLATLDRSASVCAPWRLRKRDGEVAHVEVTVRPVVFRGRASRFVMANDVTERVRTEAALRESEEKFRQLAEGIRQVFWMSEPESGRIIYVSPAYDEIWGRSREVLYSDTLALLETVHEEDRQRLVDALPRQMTGDFDEEYRIVRADGSLRWIRARAFPIRNARGEAYRIAGTAEDVTERKLAEEALRESEERFRITVDGIKDYAICLLDREGRVASWNAGGERVKGYGSAEIMGRCFSCFYPAEDVEAGKPWAELARAARDGRADDEGLRVRKDGSRFWADVVITALRDEGGRLRGFVKVARDITERKQAEQRLRQLSARLLEFQDEERRRLARELHDTTGQSLAALAINLAVVEQSAATLDERAHRALADSQSLAAQCASEIRTLSYLLHPPLLDELGLPAALRWYVHGFARRSGKVAQTRPDVVVLDITMPDVNGLEATRQILRETPDTEILILTMHDSEQLMHEVIAAGAHGYVLKSDAGRDLVAAVEALGQHRPYFTSRLARLVLDGYRRRGALDAGVNARGPGLTAREREVLQLVAEGKSNKQVAAELGISTKTADSHRTNLMRKLDLHSVSELVRYAVRNKLVDP